MFSSTPVCVTQFAGGLYLSQAARDKTTYLSTSRTQKSSVKAFLKNSGSVMYRFEVYFFSEYVFQVRISQHIPTALQVLESKQVFLSNFVLLYLI